MWYLIKTEFKYNMSEIITLFLFPVIYTALINLNFESILNIKLISKSVFGTILSLIIYVMIIKIWAERNTVNRDRFQLLLPVSIKVISFIRLFWLFLPFIIIPIYFFIIKYLVFTDIESNAFNLIGTMGFFQLIISIFLFLREVFFTFSNKLKQNRVYAIISILIILIALLICVCFELFRNYIGNMEGIPAYVLGSILFYLTYIAFQKRRTYVKGEF
jgi:hypothetical protein